MATMTREEVLKKYIGDMHALAKHILEAVERQLEDSSTQAQPEAHQLIGRIAGTLRSQHTRIHEATKKFDALDLSAKAKEAITSALGVAAGLIDKVRPYAVSKMLRDDYTALTLAAMGYEMLHTTALALKDQEVADLALSHLKDLPPLIMEIGHLTPKIIVRELASDGLTADEGVAEQAAKNTEAAWRTEKASV